MLFQYRKFPSAATHIRLVEVQAAANNEHQGITIKLHTVPFEDAPCYQAVSYTWGDNLVSKWIWIANDHGPPKMMNIGINCCLALDQIKRFGTTQYFWIDAICINQQDLDEKSHQVAMMGKIFERANSVFASVGEHAQDTEYLVLLQYDLAMKLFEENLCAVDLISNEREAETTQKARSICASWMEALDDVAFERFFKAVHAFAKRPYFWRVWVLQEVYLARYLSIYCGREEICLPNLLFWWREAKMLYPQILTRKLSREYLASAPWLNPIYFLDIGGSGLSTEYEDMLYACAIPSDERVEKKTLYFHDVVNLCVQRGCKDPRDFVYGTLVMTEDWGCGEAIMPDYGGSILDLAKTVMNSLPDMEDVIKLVKLLRLHTSHPDIAKAIEKRQELRDISHEIFSSSPITPETVGRDVIVVDGGFQLTPSSFPRIAPMSHPEDTYCRIVNENAEVCAIVPATTQEGDWLVAACTDYGFVLRQVREFFAIVGRVYFCTGYPLDKKVTAFRLSFDAEDLVVHVALGPDEGYDVYRPSEQMLQALNTNVCKDTFSSHAWKSLLDNSFSRSTFRMYPNLVAPQMEMEWHLGLSQSQQPITRRLEGNRREVLDAVGP